MKDASGAVGRRVLVTGMAGSGKSTFSRALSAKTGLPVIHLDVHYWKPGWVKPSDDEWREKQRTLLAGEAWIADGALHVTFNPDTFGPEIGEWGRLMSDCVQHIAAGIAMNGIVERQEALKTIAAAFDRGMKEAMSEATHVRAGKIKRGTKH